MTKCCKVKNLGKKWYINGLNFECDRCGRCCSGPGEGYIWITRQEIKFIADFLKMPTGQLRHKFLRRVGLRTSIIEDAASKDCIFLENINGQKQCSIYPVRPNQCRTWPFWSENLSTPDAWEKTSMKCAGVNRDRVRNFKEIEKIRKQKKWWKDGNMNRQVAERVAEIYNWLDSQSRRHGSITGTCDVCGKCCDFGKYDHRLFVTTPEIMYLAANLGEENIKPMTNGRCPYNTQGRCEIYKYRFASCRIFSCKGSPDIQSRISESILTELKSICTDMEIPYRYTDLPTAMNGVKD